jgi:hypothetical protein
MTKFKVQAAETDLPPLNLEEGTSYGWFDRWQVGQTLGGKFTTDYADWEARDLYEMLTKDYKARQIENVLSLPIMSAEYQIVPAPGDQGEAEWMNSYWSADPLSGGSITSLDQIIGLCTSAFYYKRAYFEKIWVPGQGDFQGKFVYGDVAFRPQTTCRILRDPRTGRYAGFEQEAYYMGPETGQAEEVADPDQVPQAAPSCSPTAPARTRSTASPTWRSRSGRGRPSRRSSCSGSSSSSRWLSRASSSRLRTTAPRGRSPRRSHG